MAIDNRLKDAEQSKDPRQLLELALKQAELNPQEMRQEIRLLDPTCVDTAKAITLKIGDHAFKPLVAYPIFTADYIRGYSEPKLDIEWDPLSLLAHVSFTYAEKAGPLAPDAVALLQKFMPNDTIYNNREKWLKECIHKQQETKELLAGAQSVAHTDRQQIYRLKFDHNGPATAYLRRVFMFSWFYIEGAQAPDEQDSIWDVYVAVHASTNEFRGYASVYSFLYYLSGNQFTKKAAECKLVRKRIAHFLILPPFQNQGYGKYLYQTLLTQFIADKFTYQIEVEEPSSGFEILRDRSHYEMFTKDSVAREWLQTYVTDPVLALEFLRTNYKMEDVQFQRVAEMLFYMESLQKELRDLKKMIKSRLYRHNYSDLRDMDPATQRDQLHAVYENALYMHRVALHLEEFAEEKEEEEVDVTEMLLAQLAPGVGQSVMDLLPEEVSKKRKVE